jgi:hypothetical protein
MNKEMCYPQNFFVSLCSNVLIQLDLPFTNPSATSPFYLYTIHSRVAISAIKIFLPKKTPQKKPPKKKGQLTHEIFPVSNNNLLPNFNTISRSINTTMQFTTITFELMLVAASFSRVNTSHQNTLTIY